MLTTLILLGRARELYESTHINEEIINVGRFVELTRKLYTVSCLLSY